MVQIILLANHMDYCSILIAIRGICLPFSVYILQIIYQWGLWIRPSPMGPFGCRRTCGIVKFVWVHRWGCIFGILVVICMLQFRSRRGRGLRLVRKLRGILGPHWFSLFVLRYLGPVHLSLSSGRLQCPEIGFHGFCGRGRGDVRRSFVGFREQLRECRRLRYKRKGQSDSCFPLQ